MRRTETKKRLEHLFWARRWGSLLFLLFRSHGLLPPPLAEAELQEGCGGGRTILESRRRPARTGLTDLDDNNQEDFYVASTAAGRATLGGVHDSRVEMRLMLADYTLRRFLGGTWASRSVKVDTSKACWRSRRGSSVVMARGLDVQGVPRPRLHELIPFPHCVVMVGGCRRT
jgi:hypothetical protein